jgi:hypothetical protein
MLQFLGLPTISTRVIGFAPRKIDARTFQTVLCRGGLIERPFGFERLRIAQAAVNIDRLRNGGIPVLNSYREDSIAHSLAKVIDIRVEDGAVVGVIKFHATERGQEAAELINQTGKFDISVAYNTEAIEIYDIHNRRVDANDGERASELGLAFEVTQWEICALGLLRSDQAVIEDQRLFIVGAQEDRAYHGPVAPAVAATFERMAATHMAMVDANTDQRLASRAVKPVINVSIFDDHDHHRTVVDATRARMRAAQKLIECGNTDWRDIVMPPRDMIYFGKPERM